GTVMHQWVNLERIRDQIMLATPPDARITVLVGGGEAIPPNLHSRTFRTQSLEMVANLPALRANGWEYVLVSAATQECLVRDPELARSLTAEGSLVQQNEDMTIYALRKIELRPPRHAPKRVVALLATRNEETFIAGCLRN